ncbi:putative EG45-like domain containing protein 1 [Hibiscus syriacus]|uniref:EG45-like domain containing protein 1 n=1 Tax=Hibiscus syriacus TaxID=106335 RepID=A0A6A2YVF0_HIBSY|nr:putative EG45-like domain containing protein 1 [Hibiscus syriacus]
MVKVGIFFCTAIAFIVGFSIREAIAHTGTATFYTPPYVPSACHGYKDDGVMVAAASDAIWDDGAACGRRYKIKCKRGTNESPHPCRGKKYVVVKIVDYCPSGCQGTIDLSQEAFASIADPNAGKIKIYFHQYVNPIELSLLMLLSGVAPTYTV